MAPRVKRLFGPSVALRRAAAAVNAAGPPAGRLDDVELVGAFARVLRDTGEPEPIEIAASEAPRIRHALDVVDAAFRCEGADEAARAVNQLLSDYAGPPRLVREPGAAWHIHVDREDDDWAAWFAASSALALAVALAEAGDPTWGACQASGCRRVYARTGPGRPPRTCSPSCGTRLRVAAHRQRARMVTEAEDAA